MASRKGVATPGHTVGALAPMVAVAGVLATTTTFICVIHAGLQPPVVVHAKLNDDAACDATAVKVASPLVSEGVMTPAPNVV